MKFCDLPILDVLKCIKRSISGIMALEGHSNYMQVAKLPAGCKYTPRSNAEQ
jgi:hypothetical protein